jgi:H+-transporting ATPase
MLITLLNDGTLIAIGYDNVVPRQTPEKWNLPALFLISSVLAAVACISSLLILGLALDSWTPGHLFQEWGVGGLSYGQITTTIYLKVSISDFLTLFSARTGDKFFWTTRPAWILLGAGGFALSLSTIIACSWPPTYPDGIYALGLARRAPYALAVYIWIYCIVWWFIQDLCKVGTYWLLEKYNWFEYNNVGTVVLPETTVNYIHQHKQVDMDAAAAPHGAAPQKH